MAELSRGSTSNNGTTPLLELSNVAKHFPVTKGIIFSKRLGTVRAVDGVSLNLVAGDTYGLVGESGCGKTTLSRMVLLLLGITSGEIRFQGRDISKLEGPELAKYRQSVQAVFQDPYRSLSPRMRIFDIIAEPAVAAGKMRKAEIKDKVEAVLEAVALPHGADRLYPHEFSGGQRQRIAVARSIVTDPELVVLDEPTSALDVSVRAQIMNLLKDVREKVGMSYLVIAHDLGVIRFMCNKMGVMYKGKLVESGTCDEVFSNPVHPYTRVLLASARPFRPGDIPEIIPEGEVGKSYDLVEGCLFEDRCPEGKERCAENAPQLVTVDGTHRVACHKAQGVPGSGQAERLSV